MPKSKVYLPDLRRLMLLEHHLGHRPTQPKGDISPIRLVPMKRRAKNRLQG